MVFGISALDYSYIKLVAGFPSAQPAQAPTVNPSRKVSRVPGRTSTPDVPRDSNTLSWSAREAITVAYVSLQRLLSGGKQVKQSVDQTFEVTRFPKQPSHQEGPPNVLPATCVFSSWSAIDKGGSVPSLTSLLTMRIAEAAISPCLAGATPLTYFTVFPISAVDKQPTDSVQGSFSVPFPPCGVWSFWVYAMLLCTWWSSGSGGFSFYAPRAIRDSVGGQRRGFLLSFPFLFALFRTRARFFAGRSMSFGVATTGMIGRISTLPSRFRRSTTKVVIFLIFFRIFDRGDSSLKRSDSLRLQESYVTFVCHVLYGGFFFLFYYGRGWTSYGWVTTSG